jgi:hypothetical protein
MRLFLSPVLVWRKMTISMYVKRTEKHATEIQRLGETKNASFY